MKSSTTNILLILSAVLCTSAIQRASAAVSLDRTRVIFDGSQKSMSLDISNKNKQLPYLAQAWIEDEKGERNSKGPLIVLPPVQRIEPGKSSQVKIQALPTVNQLPQDRESVFYFNLREIPPKSDKPNTLQIALQTRIKLFYRPSVITQSKNDMDTPWQEKITLTKNGDKYHVNNPTPYFVTIVGASSTIKGENIRDFEPFMIEPKGNKSLGNGSVSGLGKNPILTYINDYGGRPQLIFNCTGNLCSVKPKK
ncbi:fimbria/pilus periplasmic chaperone [Klebsiella aerogenes]|uniref:fimbria/pilus periplasmic chaperone n=1 Tax=Klebsiella aerogenes TaxID=548 RepID=UPI00063CEB35|nr:fimbria/pilus periplasmic chaperone [Klebsiella aerogenes]KLF43441.1 molecular chaperone [Klebsiella aerogenes]